jgi:hypothetical protein
MGIDENCCGAEQRALKLEILEGTYALSRVY